MIIGTGIDIVSKKRIQTIFLKYQNSFCKKILSVEEVAIFSKINSGKMIDFLSKKFSAKEAILKAIGCGVCSNFTFCDIVILNDSNGKPFVVKNNKILSIIKTIHNIDNFNMHISISDEKEYAIANTILEKI